MRQAPERPAAFVFPLFIWFSHLLCLLLQRETRIAIMETRKFATRGEQSEYYAKLRGWEPLTEEDKKALDDAIRLVTHLD